MVVLKNYYRCGFVLKTAYLYEVEYAPEFHIAEKKNMRIGELSEKTGLSTDTIRFYEKAGVISDKDFTRQKNGYKIYDADLAKRLLLVKQAKNFGFTLREIRDLTQEWRENKLTKPEQIRVLTEKVAAVETRINELKQVKKYLTEKLMRLSRPD